jgi:flagellar assembly factor FliW
MKLATTRFGEFEVPEERIYTLISPLPGFPATKRFFFIQKEKIAPFQWMQSVEEGDLTFVVVEPERFFHDYEPAVGGGELKELGLGKVSEAKVFVIVVLPEDMTKMTANLKGPVLMNVEKRLMNQVFIESGKWGVRESIVEGIRKKEQAAIEKRMKEQQATGQGE